jgi:hypothetical protein
MSARRLPDHYSTGDFGVASQVYYPADGSEPRERTDRCTCFDEPEPHYCPPCLQHSRGTQPSAEPQEEP